MPLFITQTITPTYMNHGPNDNSRDISLITGGHSDSGSYSTVPVYGWQYLYYLGLNHIMANYNARKSLMYAISQFKYVLFWQTKLQFEFVVILQFIDSDTALTNQSNFNFSSLKLLKRKQLLFLYNLCIFYTCISLCIS